MKITNAKIHNYTDKYFQLGQLKLYHLNYLINTNLRSYKLKQDILR